MVYALGFRVQFQTWVSMPRPKAQESPELISCLRTILKLGPFRNAHLGLAGSIRAAKPGGG